ncbi:MAG: protein kinase [Pseudomonadota bacterium]
MSDPNILIKRVEHETGCSVGQLINRSRMSSVYLARREGQRFVLKIPLANDLKSAKALAHETDVLQLAQTEGVVHLIDRGVFSGQPWLLLEHIEGPSLQDLLPRGAPAAATRELTAPLEQVAGDRVGPATDQSDSDGAQLYSRAAQKSSGHGTLLTLIAQLATTLDVIHSRGVVHRDLKPDNVLISEHGPVLIDFGIATQAAGATHKESIGARFDRAGTLAYVAPEQLLPGQIVDFRADLYSLGAILFHCVIGRPAFIAENRSLKDTILNEPPPLVAEQCPELATELIQLIDSLLVKAPGQRARRTIEIVEVLRRNVPSATSESQAGGDDRSAGPASLPAYHFRAPLIGRHGELAQITESLTTIADESTICIEGESGMGKTRLAQEAIVAASEMGYEVHALQCRPSGHGGASGPMAPLVPLLEEIVLALSSGRLVAAEETDVAQTIDILASLYPNLAAVRGHSPRPLDGYPVERQRELIIEALSEGAILASGANKVLVVVDDLQWVDTVTLDFILGSESKSAAGWPLRFLVTWRSDEIDPQVSGRVEEHGCLRLPLAPLALPEIRTLAAKMLATNELSSQAFERLHEDSLGNPFFVAEYLSFVDQGADDAESAPLPRGIAELLEHRLKGVGELGRIVLNFCAVLGNDAEVELLAELSQTSPAQVEQILARFRDLRILTQKSAAAAIGRTHDRYREFIYGQLTDVRSYHERCATALEPIIGTDRSRSVSLGSHWSLAAQPVKAAAFFEIAATEAESVYAHEDAATYLQWTLNELNKTNERINTPVALLYERLGSIKTLLGDIDAAAADFSRQIETTDNDLTAARGARLCGKLLQRRTDEALTWFDRAEDFLNRLPPTDIGVDEERVELRLCRVRCFYWNSRVDDMRSALVETGALAVRCGWQDRQGDLEYLKALFESRIRGFRPGPTSIDLFREALDRAQELGDLATIGSRQLTLGMMLLWLPDHEEAMAKLDAARQTFERLGDQRGLVLCKVYQSLALRFQDHRALCADLTEVLLNETMNSSLPEYEGVARSNLGWIAYREADWARAVEQCEAAIQCWEKSPIRYAFYWLAVFPLAGALVQNSRLSELTFEDLSDLVLDDSQQRLDPSLQEALRRGDGQYGGWDEVIPLAANNALI